MRFVVTLDYSIDDNKVRQSNEFFCRRDQLVSKVYFWIRDIKMETGYRKTIIERVLVNDSFEIAEEVKNYKVIIDDLWIPF